MQHVTGDRCIPEAGLVRLYRPGVRLRSQRPRVMTKACQGNFSSRSGSEISIKLAASWTTSGFLVRRSSSDQPGFMEFEAHWAHTLGCRKLRRSAPVNPIRELRPWTGPLPRAEEVAEEG